LTRRQATRGASFFFFRAAAAVIPEDGHPVSSHG
jgi:hypothetical protein